MSLYVCGEPESSVRYNNLTLQPRKLLAKWQWAVSYPVHHQPSHIQMSCTKLTVGISQDSELGEESYDINGRSPSEISTAKPDLKLVAPWNGLIELSLVLVA